jgi:hypothetical protein
MALGSTQPLTEMSTRNFPGDKVWSARKVDNLTAICEPIVYKMWEPRRLTTLWALTAYYMDSFTFYLFLTLIYDTRRSEIGNPEKKQDGITLCRTRLRYEKNLFLKTCPNSDII